jgi:hypothetical protein
MFLKTPKCPRKGKVIIVEKHQNHFVVDFRNAENIMYKGTKILSHTQYIYIINNVKLNSGQHVSVTQYYPKFLTDTFILEQSYMLVCCCPELHITKLKWRIAN